MRYEWFSAEDIAAARSDELPSTARGISMLAEREGWRDRDDKARLVGPSTGSGQSGRGRPRWEYHISLLPRPAQMRLVLMHEDTDAERKASNEQSVDLWRRYERLPQKAKDEAARRLEIVDRFQRHYQSGLTVDAAAVVTGYQAGVDRSTIHNWRKLVDGVARGDWLAALAPAYRPTAQQADCHPDAWDVLVSDYLRPEKPSFSACARRMRNVARERGWEPIPSDRSLRRRIEREIAPAVLEHARNGKDMAKRLYPAQRRTRATLHAMEAVNMDGHRLDVFVALPGQDKPVRMHLIALQDLYSGKIVAWRMAESENKVAVRLVIGDMVEAHGIPERIVLDNGRAFASKWITGGMPNRFRFKVRDEEPQGLLKSLGVEVHWTKPYSGQSKPIERAFRDLAEEIAKHPFCSGAYVGNRPDAKPENYGSRAVPVDAFRDHVARMIAEHNARPGRDTETAKGRSFDETFADSYTQSIVRYPTQAQKALWLLAAERVSAQRGSGEIHLFGNRYWAPEMNAHAGRKVTVRFDPDNLHRAICVYSTDDRLICEAECVADTGFFDAEAAQEHGRRRAAWERVQREQMRLHRTLTADELADIYGSSPAPAAPPAEPPKVKRLAVGPSTELRMSGNLKVAVVPDEEPIADFETNFSKGLRLIASRSAEDE